MSNEPQKPVIGFTCGDLNGIGIELIIKLLADGRIIDLCVPIVFASNKSINFYRKTLPEINFSYSAIKDFSRINPKQVNIFNCWEEEVVINPGILNETGGKYARIALHQATKALKDKNINGLVTGPIHKKNIQSPEFNFTGHTPYLKNIFGVNDVAMIMTSSNLRVCPLTEHVPINEISKHITKQNITSKIAILNESLQRDFGINKPRIAVLGLNPHAGDDGIIGNEEINIIKPAIKEMRDKNILVFGPYSADAFFARAQYKTFDVVLAMYHDQGLIPFKSLCVGEGVNYTAGLPAVRTSPDHGTAFDIAGKGIADISSFFAATFECIDIINRRKNYADNRSNPLRKMGAHLVANSQDETIAEDEVN